MYIYSVEGEPRTISITNLFLRSTNFNPREMLKIALLTLTKPPMLRAHPHPRATHSSFHQPQAYAIRIECRAFEPRGTCTAYRAEGRGENCRKSRVRPCRRKLADGFGRQSFNGSRNPIRRLPASNRVTRIEGSNTFSRGWCVVGMWQRNIRSLIMS